MKKNLLMYVISISSLLFICCLGLVFGWFIPKKNSGILINGNTDIEITGYIDQIDADTLEGTADFPKKLTTSKQTIRLESFSNKIMYIFVVKNNANTDMTITIKLSDFTKYIFDSYNETVNKSTDISDSLIKKARLYNSKFFLNFSNLYIRTGNAITETLVDSKNTISYNNRFIDNEKEDFIQVGEFADDTKFLWKYGMNDPFASFKLVKNETKSIFIEITNAQSSVSLKTDYINWLLAKGIPYIRDIKKETDEDKIKNYLNLYYIAEAKTLVNEDSDELPETTLDIDYFEFVADTDYE